jgi:hypothetical protein
MTAHQVRSYVPSVTTDDHRPHPVPHYEIRLAGHLGARWSAWFDGLTVVRAADGTTVLTGPVVDQAALHGLLQKLRDIGIPLVSLTQIPRIDPADPSAGPNQEGS